jgi:glc operon protein GlcG
MQYASGSAFNAGTPVAARAKKHSRELERTVMPVTRQQTVITVSAALDLIHAAIAEGDRIGVPVSACVVDTSMSLVAFARSDGATPHSADTSRAKANTAASIRRPTGGMGEDLALPLAVATDGRLTNIRGGSPIRFDDAHAGGLGIAGGTPAQDAEVAEAALARVGAQAVPGAQ